MVWLSHLVGTPLLVARPPRDPVVSSARLVVGRWGAATAAASSLEGSTWGSGRSDRSAGCAAAESGEAELAVDGHGGQAKDGSQANEGLHSEAGKETKGQYFINTTTNVFHFILYSL